jgi:hypothetical protein
MRVRLVFADLQLRELQRVRTKPLFWRMLTHRHL